MTVVDEYVESPMEADDMFPCKGCGEILEEGKAFELAGNRWHLNCFRCHSCGTLLDSDANLLLLGDGSLICNNCTYSCSACGNKIEDLAILTGDQAFCATCFRCRNCKRKIENLRYARTSQGIFCMSCHESLMARRRKKSKAAAQAKAREKDGSPMVTEKSLPALPPNAIPPNAFSNDRVSPESDTPTELSPPPRPQYSRADSGSRSSSRPSRSPERQTLDRPAEIQPGNDGSLSIPAPNYRNNRNSSIISGEVNLDGDSFFIPVALDPSPAPSLTPRSTTDVMSEQHKKSKDKEPLVAPKRTSSEKAVESTSAVTSPAPHIAFQEKTRQPSSEFEGKPVKEPQRKLSKSRQDKNAPSKAAADDKQKNLLGKGSPSGADGFKLQEAPKSKRLISPRSNSQSNVPSGMALGIGSAKTDKDSPSGMPSSDSAPLLQLGDKAATPRNSQDVRFKDDESRSSVEIQPPPRQDNGMRAIPRKELPQPTTGRNVNGKAISGPLVRSATSDELVPAGQSSLARPAMPDGKMSDTYMQPRAPPALPAQTPGKDSMSSSANESPSPNSPKLPRWSATGDFSMDEDMARILGTDEGSSSILRRVSKAVRHGRTNSAESNTTQTRLGHARSVSETTRATASPRWPKTPIAEDPVNGHAHDISSPISLSSSADDPAFLKRQLRNSEQRVAELERQFLTEKDLRSLNKKLIEKRKTVSVLDTQTEIMIRQLEVLAGYVERAKDTKQPIDVRELEDSAIKEFVQKLDKVKQTMAAAIEALHAERDELVEDKNKAIADRDRALLEFEQLSSKNAQLADLNNDLTHQIQERFKAQADPRSPSVNTLGIYAPSRGNVSVDLYNTNSLASGSSTQVVTDPDEPVLEQGPTVVNIRKGQVRKFNWKKGSKTVAQNVAKGVKGAVGAFQVQERDRPHQGLTGDNIGLPYNMTVSQVDSPAAFGQQNGLQQQNRQASESRQGFGFFKKNTLPKSLSTMNMSTPTIAEAPTTLFGSELTERADYERRTIPSVVSRCIEEVELRGMDVEGIYRKTGGNSQVKMIQDGFERNEDYDISDPNVDITAVTSALKQYFRKLPTPLLTYDVYDRVLESNSITNEPERASHLRKTFNMLPQRHRDCLEFLMFHLSRVANRERENLMSPKNLAVVFAPTIMRDHNIEREMTDMHAKNSAVQFVIEHSQTIFSEA